jgi:hypothetical protein
MHLMNELLWAGLPYSAGLGYFPGCFGDKLQILDDYLQWHCFLLPLGNSPLGCFSVYSLLAGAKRKRRRKERKKMCSFRNKHLYIFCSLL